MTIDSSGSKGDTLHLRNRANVRSENSDEPKMSSMEQPRRNSGRTMGTTPDGTTFVVPETHDMVSQILDPRQPHNFSDGLVVAINVLLITVMYMLPGFAKQPVFAGIFLFWRACYNIGIGWLLAKQSKSKQLTTWAEKSRVFDDPKNAKNRPWLQSFVKHELEVKIPEDYDFDKAPLEYNTWLVFRRVVDLVLMCDFTSYCLFAYTCGGRPAGEILPITVARWVIGIGLIIFNLWVKLDAHRVVKDYAWYWGDFFYMTDKELTFDGVFKLFPHPMYSVGYAGYYGISLMAASYKVLLISVVAHVAQLTFLHIVENPHIEKTYPSPSKTENDNVEKLS